MDLDTFLKALPPMVAALLGFAAGYGALRAMVNQMRDDMRSVSADAKTTSAALTTVTADARHYAAQLAAQTSQLSDLADRVRILEIDVATLKAS